MMVQQSQGFRELRGHLDEQQEELRKWQRQLRGRPTGWRSYLVAAVLALWLFFMITRWAS